MFPGGGGMDNRKMQQMMKQMGIEMQDIDAQEIVIKTPEEDLVFSADAEVQRMDAQGQQTYTIVGEPESRPKGEGGGESETEPETESVIEESDGDTGGVEIEDADVELVAQRAGVPEDDAREALEETDGDLAAAVARLE